jgi:ribosome-binding protein aMBF1 (putative translation factor)
MKSDQLPIDIPQYCDLCQRRMNPTIHIYGEDTRLCNDCYCQLESAPEVVAKSIERFLIGNVV